LTVTDSVWAQRAHSFARAADDYDRGRPGYPAEAIRWCLPEPAGLVLDVGAGTGKLAAGLLELGLDVVAVEPADELRRLLPRPVRALPGRAEAIPVPDGSVDAAFAAQAFHWFDPEVALPELARVVRSGGTIGLFWNLMDDRVPWVADFVAVVDTEARASLMRPDPPPPYRAVPGLAQPEHRAFEHEQVLDADDLVAAAASMSRVILLPPDRRAAVLEEVRRLAPRGRFALPHVCTAWRGVRT
jgi:SAM-dependent methyltransferase